MNFNPFIDLIANIINFYSWMLGVWIVAGWLIALDIINRHNPNIQKVMHVMNRLIEPILMHIRKYMPNIGIDISPIVLFFGLGFIKSSLYTYFYQ
jgi:YggT family protein